MNQAIYVQAYVCLKTNVLKAVFIILSIFPLAFNSEIANAQVGISTTSITPDASSILELRSTSAGFLPPRMTTTQRDAIVSPATGLLVFNTTTGQLNYYTGSAWQIVSSGGGSGTVTSASVTSANGFSGTVATSTTTPAITISTSVNGIAKGNGTALSAATSGTDYSAGTSALATGILKSTTTTGALSIATVSDFPTLNQNTTGSASNVSGTNVITNSNLSQMAANTIKGNNTAGTANAADLTAAQVNAMLPTFTSLLNGIVPLSGGGTANFLRADGTWAVPPTVTSVNSAITAAGTTQATATSLTSDYNVVTTVTPTADGVKLPLVNTGNSVYIVNNGTNTLEVYPLFGGTIDALGSNVPYDIQVGGAMEFKASSSTQWFSTSNVVKGKVTLTNSVSDILSNTYTDITGLSFEATAGALYQFKATIIYSSGSTANGSGWSINGPGTPTLLAFKSNFPLTATTEAGYAGNAYNLPASSSATSAYTTGNIAVIQGFINVATSGSVIIRFRSETTSGITVQPGSVLEWW